MLFGCHSVEMPHRTSDLPLISWLLLYQRLSHPDPLFTETFGRKSLPGICEQSPRNSTELTYAKNSKLTVLICSEISYPSIIRLTPSGRSLSQNQRKIFCFYIDILPSFSSSPILSQLKTGCYYQFSCCFFFFPFVLQQKKNYKVFKSLSGTNSGFFF